MAETTSRHITLAREGARRGDESLEFANDTKRTLTTERINVLRTGSVLQTYFPNSDIPMRGRI
jgi:hypothetical protein